MGMTEKREHLLSKLLAQFFITYSMSKKESRVTYGYLFKGLPVPPFFKDADLYETLTYLRDVVVDQKINTIAGLLQYVAGKKERIGHYLDELINSPQPQVYENTGEYRVLNDDIDTFDETTKRPVAGPGLLGTVTTSIKQLLAEKPFSFEQYREYYDHLLKGLGRSYLRAFLSPKDKDRFCILDREGNDQMEMDSGSYTIFPDCDYSRLSQAGETRADQVYLRIMSEVERETPIWGARFKQLLVEWIFLLNRSINPAIRELHGPLLYTRRWIILKSPEKHPWITSDSPGFLTAGDPGPILHYPLSRNYCLRIQPEPEGKGRPPASECPVHFVQCYAKEARLVNELTIAASRELVVASRKKDLRLAIGL